MDGFTSGWLPNFEYNLYKFVPFFKYTHFCAKKNMFAIKVYKAFINYIFLIKKIRCMLLKESSLNL